MIDDYHNKVLSFPQPILTLLCTASELCNAAFFWLDFSTKFARFRARFCSTTAAWRRTGSGRCPWSWRPHLAGCRGRASPGRRARACGRRGLAQRTAGPLRNFPRWEITSPWSGLAVWVASKRPPKRCPAKRYSIQFRAKFKNLYWEVYIHVPKNIFVFGISNTDLIWTTTQLEVLILLPRLYLSYKIRLHVSEISDLQSVYIDA